MAPNYIHLVTEFPTIGGDPLDFSHITTNWIGITGAPIDAANDACVGMQNFLGGPLHAGQVNKMDAYLGAQLDRTASAVSMKAYDVTAHLNGTPAGAPILIRRTTLGASLDDAPLPEGVACAVSFHSPYGADVEFGHPTRPRARDRGRFYLGPLARATITNDPTTHRNHFLGAFMNDVTFAGLDMRSYVGAAAGTNWAVWSRKAARMTIVSAGWVDDRPDYQRRREDQSPSRALF